MVIFNSIVNFLHKYLFWFEFFSLIISGILLWLIVTFNIKLGLTHEKIDYWADVWSRKNIEKRKSFNAWKQIAKRFKTGNPAQLKVAILEADNILNEIFKMAAYPGRNLDERLEKITPAQIPNIEELRQAHKIRDKIISEPNFYLTPGEAEIALNIYKKVFVDLDLIREND